MSWPETAGGNCSEHVSPPMGNVPLLALSEHACAFTPVDHAAKWVYNPVNPISTGPGDRMLQQPNPRRVQGLHGTRVLRQATAALALQGGLAGPTAGP